MIGPEDIKRWAESSYMGFLRSLITGESVFPMRRDRLGRVNATHDQESFLSVVTPLWKGSKAVTGNGYSVVLERKNRRNRGEQNEPVAVEIIDREDYHGVIGKRSEAAAFERDVKLVRAVLPEAMPVLIAEPILVVDHAGAWEGIVEVVQYLRSHPRPGCFVRALPVSVHTKFIEEHESAIEALCAVLPETCYDKAAPDFHLRCGFFKDESSIRGRFLCPTLQRLCGFPVDDVKLRVSGWASIKFPEKGFVVVCENKANFLALPSMPNTLAIWGQGGAASGLLGQVEWMKKVAVLYWGDIDPYGYVILSGIRRSIPGTISIMMDAETISRHRNLLLPAKLPPGAGYATNLNASEKLALEQLVSPPMGIEQEKLLFQEAWVSIQEILKSYGQ